MILNIDIDTTAQDLLDQLVVKTLKDSYEMMSQPQNIPVFSCDPKKEKKKLKKFLKSLKLVHNWYTIHADHL